MIKNAPVVEKTGAQTFYNGNRSRGLFGFFGSGSSLAGLSGGKSDALGNVFGNGYYVHKINGRRVSWYHKARYMRRCATVNFLRLMFVGRLLANQYSIESDEGVPEYVTDLVRENFNNWWDEIIKHASFGCMDFGWQGFEMVYRLEDGYWNVDKVKPLLHDITGILEATQSGDFIGFDQGTNKLYCDDGGVMLFNFIPEGTYHYGQAPMKAVECAFDRQDKLFENIEHFDGRLASTHWAIYYPIGKSPVAWNDDGTVSELKDNYDIALETMQYLLMNGSVIIPSSIDESIQRLNEIGGNAKGPWRIEVLSPGEGSSGTSPYQERLRYYDVSMARALGFPERSVFEGEHGTKAESESQGEMSSVISTLYQQELCRGGNDYFIPDIIRTNAGDRYAKSVRIVPTPSKIDEQAFLRDLYRKLIDNPEILFVEHEKLDLPALREMVGVPVDEDVDDEESLIEVRLDRDEPEDEPEETKEEDVELAECGANAPGGGGFQKGNSCAGGGDEGEEARTDDRFGLPLNDDGTVTLYHGTNEEGEAGIRSSGGLIGKENGVFLTTSKDDIGFGSRIVEVTVDPDRLDIDDEFPDGRMDFRIAARPGELVTLNIIDPEDNTDET